MAIAVLLLAFLALSALLGWTERSAREGMRVERERALLEIERVEARRNDPPAAPPRPLCEPQQRLLNEVSARMAERWAADWSRMHPDSEPLSFDEAQAKATATLEARWSHPQPCPGCPSEPPASPRGAGS